MLLLPDAMLAPRMNPNMTGSRISATRMGCRRVDQPHVHLLFVKSCKRLHKMRLQL
jgi:hypothetical protein